MLERLKILFLLLLFVGPTGCIEKTNTSQLRERNAMLDLANIYDWEKPLCIEKPLNLYDVVDIALVNNLDLYAQEFERESQARISNAEHLKMLPPLTLDGLWSFRTKNTASFQKTIFPDSLNPTPAPEVIFPQLSSIKTTVQTSIRESIRFVDTALAYFRARQEKNKTLILEQQHLRARQKLILDITEAYWKAIAAKNALEDMEQLIGLSENFQEVLRRHIERKTLSALQGLDLEARLVDQQIQLEAIRNQYQSSKIQLAGLMGLLPGMEFELVDADLDFKDMDGLDLKILEQEALFFRPELSVKDLEEKIALDKIRESIIPMLPDSSLYTDDNYDGNPFLLHNYWWSVGVRATWNLFLIAQQWQFKRSAENQKELARISRLALSVSVITQVHLAYINYRDLAYQYKLALRAFAVRADLAEVAEKVKRAGEFQGIDVLNFQSSALLAKINAWRAYANLQIAREQLDYAIGKPLWSFSECN